MAKQLYAPLVFIEKCNKYGGYSEKNLKDNYYDHLLKDVIHIPKDKLQNFKQESPPLQGWDELQS